MTGHFSRTKWLPMVGTPRRYHPSGSLCGEAAIGLGGRWSGRYGDTIRLGCWCGRVAIGFWLSTVRTLRRYHPSGSLCMMPSSCGHEHYCEVHARAQSAVTNVASAQDSTAAARRKVRINGEVAARRAARCNIHGTHLGLAAAARRSGHTGRDAVDRRTVFGQCGRLRASCCYTRAGYTSCSEYWSTSVFV